MDKNKMRYKIACEKINIYLKRYDFDKADEQYEQNKDIISHKDYMNFRNIYKMLEKMEACLQNSKFNEADAIYEKNKNIISHKKYLEYKHKYVNNYLKEIWSNILSTLEQFDFINADKLFQSNKDLINDNDYNCEKIKYIEQYKKIVWKEIIAYLKEFNFKLADEKFEDNKFYLDDLNEYTNMREKYKHLHMIISCLDNYDFDKANELYKLNKVVSPTKYQELYNTYEARFDLLKLQSLRKVESLLEGLDYDRPSKNIRKIISL